MKLADYSSRSTSATRKKNITRIHEKCFAILVIFSFTFILSFWTDFETIRSVHGSSRKSARKILHIGGIFPVNGSGGWQGGQACQPAAKLALEDVNNKSDLLQGYELEIHYNDSQCEPGLGAAAMYHLLYNQPTKLMLLAGCSTVCTTVAEAANLWNLVVLCYGASSPALSNRNRFQTLFRTHPNAIVHNPTRIALMKVFGWKRIAILQQAEEVFITTVENLEEKCKQAGIEIVTRQSFLTDPSEAVRNLQRQDARIVVGLFYVVAARRVLCEIYRNNLYGKKYVWFFIGWYENNWYETNLKDEKINCTKEEMKKAAEGHLTTEAIMWNSDRQIKTRSGMSANDFDCRLKEMLKSKFDVDNNILPEGYQEAPLAYDAVWAVAIAFNKTIEKLKANGKKLEDFSYENREIKDSIYDAMNDVEFDGISGRVAFGASGDRIALTQVEQMRNGTYTKLAYYDTVKDNMIWENNATWEGGKPPQDMTYTKNQLRAVSLSLFISMSTVASVGILWASVLIVFNYIYRERKVIQLSHPVTNTLMLIGFCLCFVSIFFIGLDGQFVPESVFPIMCTFRKWILSIGFTLSYGAMFSKVWRVHRLATKHKSEAKHKIQPWKLYLLVATLVGIDVIYLTIWTLVDPMVKKEEFFPEEDPKNTDEDYKIIPYLEHCESSHKFMWLGITYSFKALLLIFGLFLAYETRSLKVRHINDSRLVAMSIYNVAVLCLITTPVTMVIHQQQDASFAFVSLAIIFSSMITMGLVFVPKILEVVREGNEKSDRSSAPDGGTTKEDEEKYHKLLTENDQLKKILEQKEERLKLLRVKLEEKNASRRSGDFTTNDETTPGNQSGGLDGSGGGKTITISTIPTSGLLGPPKSNNNMSSGVVSGPGGTDRIEVIETYYIEPNSDSAIGQGLSIQTTTDYTELSESYL